MSKPKRRIITVSVCGFIVAVAGVIVTLTVPEIRCFVHLDGPKECNGPPQPSSSAVSEDDEAARADFYRKEHYFYLIDGFGDGRSAVLQYKIGNDDLKTVWNSRGDQQRRKIPLSPVENVLVKYRACTGEKDKTPPEHCGKWTIDSN